MGLLVAPRPDARYVVVAERASGKILRQQLSGCFHTKYQIVAQLEVIPSTPMIFTSRHRSEDNKLIYNSTENVQIQSKASLSLSLSSFLLTIKVLRHCISPLVAGCSID